jgi:hypothetical protein
MPATPPDETEMRLVRSAYNTAGGILTIPMADGRIAIYTRQSHFHSIVESLEEIDLIAINSECKRIDHWNGKIRSAARFYGEPDDKNLARDLRRERAPVRTRLTQAAIDDLAIDL